MFARVAQWWSIALPRRGSRVRIPSRALKEIEKRVIRWMALFSMFKPCRARTVRMSTLHSGRRRTSPGRSATSRAFNSMKKRDIRLDVSFFLCSSPAGLEGFECLRSAAGCCICWIPLLQAVGNTVDYSSLAEKKLIERFFYQLFYVLIQSNAIYIIHRNNGLLITVIALKKSFY